MQRQQGLTLLELIVVLAIIALATTAVSLSLRDSSQTQLEREAQRLVAVLEAARAQSRTSGIALIWQATPEGFVIRSAIATQLPTQFATRTETWLANGTQALVSATTLPTNNVTPTNMVLLGPEPIIAPARIMLSLGSNANTNPTPTVSLSTDGLHPFQVVP